MGFKGVKSACPEGLVFGARLAPNDLIAVTPQILGFPIGITNSRLSSAKVKLSIRLGLVAMFVDF